MSTETAEQPTAEAQPLQLMSDYQVSPADFLPAQDGQREFPFFTVLETGLSVHEDMPETEWLEAVQAALLAFKTTKESHIKMMFRVGDLLQFGSLKFGERWGQACNDAMLAVMSESMMSRAMWVAAKIDPETRREDLFFEHHELVAKFEPAEQRKLLTKAATKHWSTGDLKEEIKRLHPSKPRVPKKKDEGGDSQTPPIAEDAALAAAQMILDYFTQQEAELEAGKAVFQEMTAKQREAWETLLKPVENLAIRCRRAIKRANEGE